MDLEAEKYIASIDGTSNLGFAVQERFQADWLGPEEKLEQPREQLQLE